MWRLIWPLTTLNITHELQLDNMEFLHNVRLYFLINNDFTTTKEEELQKAKFIAKPREELTTTTSLKFNSRIILLIDDNSITLTQLRYSNTLRLIISKLVDSTSSYSVVQN